MNKLSMKVKLGYGIGLFANGLCYVLFYSFFLMFLTDYAGVNPAWAGSISLIVIIWDAITDPIVGYLSDKWGKGKTGRRSPLMLLGIVPWCISVIGMFIIVDFSEVGKFIYYVTMSVIFWTAFTLIFVPHSAWGAELTDDYKERGSLCLTGQFFSSAGTCAASSFTLLLVEFFVVKMAMNATGAWKMTAVVFAIVSTLALLCCVFSLKKLDTKATVDGSTPSPLEIFKSYHSMLKEVKPLKWMLLAILAFMCGNSLYGSAIIYAFNVLVGYTPAQIATISMYLAVIGLLGPVVLNAIIAKVDKKNVLATALAISTTSMLAFKFIGLDTSAKFYVYATFYSISNLGFWGLFWSFIYDCCEVDYLATGNARQATMSSFASMTQKIGSAISMWIIGVVLAAGGYNGMAVTQSASAMTAILDLMTTIPGILTGIALICLCIYPLNAKRFQKVKLAIAQKEKTGSFDKEGIEKII